MREAKENRLPYLFGGRLKKLREAIDLPQKDLARLLGLPAYLLNRYENGNNGSLARLTTIRTIARFFGVSLDWLLSTEDDTEQPPPLAKEELPKIRARAYHVLALRYAGVAEDDIPAAVQEIERVVEKFKNKEK